MAKLKRVRTTKSGKVAPPRYVIWQTTRECNLPCVHCDMGAPPDLEGELTTDEAAEFIESVVADYRTTVIFSGGEPLLRADIFDLAEYAFMKGLRVIFDTNGSLFDADMARRAVEARVNAMQIGLDGASSRAHDGFRKCTGAFTKAIRAIELVRLAGIPLEINSFFNAENLSELPKVHGLAQKLGARSHNIQLAIPHGWGERFAGTEIPVEKYQETLGWLFEQKYRLKINLKVICQPQFHRVVHERGDELPNDVNPLKSSEALVALGPGCPGGKLICYVTADGEVQPCAFWPTSVGNVREGNFKKLWEKGSLFQELRSSRRYGGKCGPCPYSETCGGCRARAHGSKGNYMAEDPYCPFQP